MHPPYFNPSQNPQWAQQQMNGVYHNPAYSSHYTQAYMQSQAGYYQQQAPPLPQHYSVPGPSNHHSRPAPPPHGQWYQPGNKRCTYKGCSFTGSHSSVETHMMDRHLIYPPGWEKRQAKPDWDADPSLKGKPIPIQGTNIALDDPEQLAAWIAERKKRFPTSARVVDKKRKMDDAVARGQLTAEDMGLRPDKKRRGNDTSNANSIPIRENHSRGRGSQLGGRGRGRGGAMSSINAASLPRKPETAIAAPSLIPRPVATSIAEDENNLSDSEGEPEVLTSKKGVEPIEVPSKTPEEDLLSAEQEQAAPPKGSGAQTQQRKRPPPQPKKPPTNPFASRPSLLRNLIVPEIRVTVSNLSQAIRFLVDNDFLRGVELKPGEATEAKIQVLDSHEEEQNKE